MKIGNADIRTFRALRNRDYALLWSGQMGNSASLWVEAIARNWLIWELTGSGTMLAMVNLLRTLPMLIFGVFAGVAADRFDKRKILLIANAFTFLNKAVLAALILSGKVEVWHVMLTAFLAGASMAFEQPTRTAIIPSLIKGEALNSAIALNSAAMNVTRVIGPATAGLLLTPIGTGGVCAVAATVYLFTLVANFYMRVPKETPVSMDERSMWTDMLEGFRYVYKEKQVFSMILLALVPIVIAWPYQTLLPMFADNVLGVGSSGYGFLNTAAGVGALLAVIVIASMSRVKRKGLMTLLAVLVFGVLLIGFSQSKSMPLSLSLMVGVGFMSTSVMVLTNTVLLTVSPPELHGRVMGVYRLDRGLMPLGQIAAGGFSDAIGAPQTMLYMGGLCALMAVLMGVFMPFSRKID